MAKPHLARRVAAAQAAELRDVTVGEALADISEVALKGTSAPASASYPRHDKTARREAVLGRGWRPFHQSMGACRLAQACGAAGR